MRRQPIVAAIFWHAVASSAPAFALEASVFVARPGVVQVLRDLNGDGDFFDFAEIRPYAESLPSSAAALVRENDQLFLLANSPPRILLLADHNDDGDALDFAEVVEYASLIAQAPTIVGLAIRGDAEILTTDPVNGVMLRVHDLNEDGDAFDTDEVIAIAGGLTAPTALAVRPDGRVLVAQNSAPVPVRILHDREGDGDFFDFAENLSYAENLVPGRHILSRTDHLAFVTRPMLDEIGLLDDRTGDGDALDFAEFGLYAENLAAPTAIASLEGDLLVATSDGLIYRLRDVNGDGDALDFGEA
ncbi:MAG TPA: hypothetical protein VNT79_16010, partial [Phycisphaerae bacterium]|nr:hypothetical protein [Phycisphaerae bacterium]